MKQVHSEETKNKIRQALIGNIPWNKGKHLVKQTKKVCPICKRTFLTVPSERKKIYCSKGCYNLDINMLYRTGGSGGYRQGSGIGKHGWYKGFHCDSSYELAYLIYNLDHNIKIERCKDVFKYKLNGVEHNYTPDFIVNKKYIEIKGFRQPDLVEKLKSLNNNYELLFKDDLKYCFEYLYEVYKKPKDRIWELYDKHKPKYKYICFRCNKEFETNRKRSGLEVSCSRYCKRPVGEIAHHKNFLNFNSELESRIGHQNKT